MIVTVVNLWRNGRPSSRLKEKVCARQCHEPIQAPRLNGRPRTGGWRMIKAGVPARLFGALLIVVTTLGVLHLALSPVHAETRYRYNATSAILSTFRLRAEVIKGDSIITAHGTGFGIDLSNWGYPRPRYVLTAWHVVRNDDGPGMPSLKIEVRTDSNIYWTRCRLLAFDARRDLCLLESATDLPYNAEFADEQTEPGSPVLHVGCPTGVRPTPFEGIVSDRDGFDLACAQVRFFKQGCSGGPVFDGTTFRIIGVAVAGVKREGGAKDEMDPTTALFVPLSSVKKFVQRNMPRRAVEPAIAYQKPVPPPETPPAAPAPPARIAETVPPPQSPPPAPPVQRAPEPPRIAQAPPVSLHEPDYSPETQYQEPAYQAPPRAYHPHPKRVKHAEPVIAYNNGAFIP